MVDRNATLLLAALTLGGFTSAAAQDGVPAPSIPSVPSVPEGPFSNEYVIDVRLDEETMTLVGTETVVFRNLSDTPVDEIPFRLYANAWSNTGTLWVRDGRADQQIVRRGEEDSGYCRIAAIRDGQGNDVGGRVRIEETLMRVPLEQPLEQNGEARFEIEFETKLPHIVARMGKFGRHVNAMQWFPKVCAHVDGRFVDWPFRNPTEFFADFGRYDVTITVPRDWVVGATGMPAAEPIVDGETRVERFEATAVHDFAWCANPNFIRHVATAESGTEVVLLSQPFAEPKAQLVLDVTTFTIDKYAEWFFPFPYPRVTIDTEPHGASGGMEYPTLFTISTRTPEFFGWLQDRSENPAGVTVHEFSHQYWYGLVASNEFEEAWLDEGFTTYMTYKVMEEFFRSSGEAPGLPVAALNRVYRPLLDTGSLLGPVAGYRESPFYSSLGRRFGGGHKLFGFAVPELSVAGTKNDRFHGRKGSYQPFAWNAPLKTMSWEGYRARGDNAYRTIAYSKPALMLRTLEGLIGWDRMLDVLRTWTRRHAFRQPTSEDFLAVASEVLDGEHAEFLESCIYGSETVDWAVEDVRSVALDASQGFTPQAAPGDPMTPAFRPVEDEPGFWSATTARAKKWFGVGEDASDSAPEGPADESTEVATEGAGATDEGPIVHATEVIVRNRGRLFVPSTVEIKYEDGFVETIALTEAKPWYRITPDPRPAKVVAARVDPSFAIALDLDVTNNSRLARPDRAAARSAASYYQFWVQSWLMSVSWFS